MCIYLSREYNIFKIIHSNHFAEEIVDKVFAVTILTTFHEIFGLLSLEATVGVAQVEGPEERIGLLEGRADGEDFMDEVFNTNNSLGLKLVFDDLVRSYWDTLTINLGKTALVDEFFHRLKVGVAPSDVGTNEQKHFDRCIVKLDKSARINFSES